MKKDIKIYFDKKLIFLETLEAQVNYYKKHFKNVEIEEFTSEGFFLVAYD